MGWSVVALGEVVAHRKQFIQIRDDESYQRCRVQLHAQGVVSRDRVLGADIKTKSQQVCRAREFLVAEIDAKHGGYGLVPSDLDGAVVSSHYFLFSVHRDRMEPEFLGWFARSKRFFEQVAAQGSTNYSAVRPRQILDFEVPLPPLDEQRRIVARLDAVAARLAARAAAAERQEAELAAMLRVLARTDTTPTPMRELLTLRPTDVEVRPEGQYQFSGVYSFGRGVFRSQRKSGADFAYPRLTTLRAGDFTYPKLMAWEGAYGIVPPECDGTVVSPEFPVFAVNAERVRPEVLALHFGDPQTWPRLSGASTGTNARRRRLHPETLLAYEMPLPAPSVQGRLQEVMAKATALRALNATTADDAAALLPAMLHEIFGRAAC
jgi:type I restriction enzyme S subunit